MRFCSVSREKASFCAGSGGSKNFEKGGGAEDNLSAPSSFITDAEQRNLLLLHGKSGFLKKTYEPIGGGGGPPLNPPLCVGSRLPAVW